VSLSSSLEPYSSYQPCSLPWLDRVPLDWSVVRIKYLVREVDRRSHDGSGTLLSLTRSRGLIRQAEYSVPEHWDVLPFVRCAVERADYRGATPEKVQSGVFLVTAKNIRMGWIDYQTSREYVREDQYDLIMRRGLPRIGDVLLTTEAPLGNVALVDREDVAFAQRVIRFRLDPRRLLPDFALYALMSSYFQYQLRIRATGSTAQGHKGQQIAAAGAGRPATLGTAGASCPYRPRVDVSGYCSGSREP